MLSDPGEQSSVDQTWAGPEMMVTSFAPEPTSRRQVRSEVLVTFISKSEPAPTFTTFFGMLIFTLTSESVQASAGCDFVATGDGDCKVIGSITSVGSGEEVADCWVASLGLVVAVADSVGDCEAVGELEITGVAVDFGSEPPKIVLPITNSVSKMTIRNIARRRQ